MAAYSGTGDLLTGNIPTPSYLDPEKYVTDAADEIDSKIGFLYKTPVVFPQEGEDGYVESRPVRLLLKRINNFLATGRLLLATSAAGEDDQLHAYGASLVKDALSALDEIAQGKITLDIERVESSIGQATTPLINNVDPESHVEAFYDRIANPHFSFPHVPYPGGSEGLVR